MRISEPQERFKGESGDLGKRLAAGRLSLGQRLLSYLISFPLMFGLWIILSGRFDSFHLTLGVISSALVAYISGDLLIPQSLDLGRSLLILFRFICYIPWLLWQIFLANIHVLRLTFHPHVNKVIDPQLLRFRTKLQSELAMVVFANSITLTPGTITVRVSAHGDFVVHAIDTVSAQALPGRMEEKIAWTFGED
jgi:multicomponent Na+:H+ antiporter subunit E